MGQKYYAAKEAPLVLTLSTTQQTTGYTAMVWNIMRMMLMSEGNEEWDWIDAESALEMLDEMPMEQFKKLKRCAEATFADWDFQKYLDLKGINPDKLTMVPVEELLYDLENEEEKNSITEQETLNRLMERLDEYGWDGFQAWEMEPSEWD